MSIAGADCIFEYVSVGKACSCIYLIVEEGPRRSLLFFVKNTFTVRLVRFQIHCELETFQFLSINDSRSNQNYFVKSFDMFIETFQIQ
jgi:hypothetical protein